MLDNIVKLHIMAYFLFEKMEGGLQLERGLQFETIRLSVFQRGLKNLQILLVHCIFQTRLEL